MNKYRYIAIAKICRVIESCKKIEQLEGMAYKMISNYMEGRSTGEWDSYNFLLPVYNSKREELRDGTKQN